MAPSDRSASRPLAAAIVRLAFVIGLCELLFAAHAPAEEHPSEGVRGAAPDTFEGAGDAFKKGGKEVGEGVRGVGRGVKDTFTGERSAEDYKEGKKIGTGAKKMGRGVGGGARAVGRKIKKSAKGGDGDGD